MGLKEENLKKLAKTALLTNFVKKNKGSWDHQKWVELLDNLKQKGYYPIDEDQVGLIIEKKKAEYSEKQKA